MHMKRIQTLKIKRLVKKNAYEKNPDPQVFYALKLRSYTYIIGPSHPSTAVILFDDLNDDLLSVLF